MILKGILSNSKTKKAAQLLSFLWINWQRKQKAVFLSIHREKYMGWLLCYIQKNIIPLFSPLRIIKVETNGPYKLQLIYKH